MRAIVALLLLPLAGCVAPPAPGDDGPAAGGDDGADSLPWTLAGCRYVVGWSDADPEVIQANLPEGFAVQAGLPLGLPFPAPGPTARAIIGTESFDCASGSGLDGTQTPMLYGSIWIPVTPPAALAVDGVGAVYYKIHVLVPDAPRLAAFQDIGLSVGSGAIAWDAPTVPDGVASDMTIDGAGDFRLEMAPMQRVAAGEMSEFMEITPAGEMGADGFAVWRATYSWDEDTFSQGRGFIDWPPDHWVADAIGAARAPATFHAGVWSFEGSVTLPSP